MNHRHHPLCQLRSRSAKLLCRNLEIRQHEALDQACTLVSALPGYVPPHSRRADGTSNAAPFSLNTDASGLGGRLGVFRPKSLVPGAAPPETKSASKNARRRKKKGGSNETDAIDGDEEALQVASQAEQTSTANLVSNGMCTACPWPGVCSTLQLV